MSLINKLTQYIKINNDLLNFIAEKMKLIPAIEGGLEKIETIPGKSYMDIPVTFNNPFIAPPDIVLSLQSNSTASELGNISCAVKYQSVNTDGFVIRLYNNDSVNRAPAIKWLAVYQPGGAVG